MLLAAPFFLITFTIPSSMRLFARSNQRVVYNTLLRSAAQAVLELCSNPRYLGALPGILAVLQTWTRDLRYHPHVHMIVSGAGLSSDQKRWIKTRYRFLIPRKSLCKIFRTKFVDEIKKKNLFTQLPYGCLKQPWGIDVRPVGSGVTALRYLAPYIFRVAISNRRILSCDNGKVSFSFKDSKLNQQRIAVLDAEDFIHRFLQHILPHRFLKVRYYGLFSPQRKKLLHRAKQLAPARINASDFKVVRNSEGILCPDCRIPMELIEILRPIRTPIWRRAP